MPNNTLQNEATFTNENVDSQTTENVDSQTTENVDSQTTENVDSQIKTKKQQLILKNKTKSREVNASYYLNRERENHNPEDWDPNGMRGIWQRFYEAERYIGQLEWKLKYYEPIDAAKALNEWLTYPLNLAALQFETLRKDLDTFIRAVREYRDLTSETRDFVKTQTQNLFAQPKNKTAYVGAYELPLNVYDEIWRQEITRQGVPTFVNCLKRDVQVKITALNNLKGTIDFASSITRIRNLIQEIEVLKNYVEMLGGAVEIQSIKDDFDAANAYLLLNFDLANLERMKGDYGANKSAYDLELQNFETFLTQNSQAFASAQNSGWLETQTNLTNLRGKLAEYKAIRMIWEAQNPGVQNNQNPGVQNPGVQNNQNPGVQNNQNPGVQNPGVQNPGVQNNQNI